MPFEYVLGPLYRFAYSIVRRFFAIVHESPRASGGRKLNFDERFDHNRMNTLVINRVCGFSSGRELEENVESPSQAWSFTRKFDADI